MFDQLIHTLKDKGLLGQEDFLLLTELELHSYSEIKDILSSSPNKNLIFALCTMIGHSRYTTVKLDTEIIIEGLIMLLKNPDWEIRQRAVETIGLLDAQAQAVYLYQLALSDPEAEVRASACHAIGLWRDPKSVPTLSSIALDIKQPVNVRETAIEALGVTDGKALPTLIELLKDENPAVRFTTLVALYNLNDAQVLPYLPSLLTDKEIGESGQTIADKTQSLISHLRSKT